MSKLDSVTAGIMLQALKQTGDANGCANIYREMTSHQEGGPTPSARQYYADHSGKLVFIVGTYMLGVIVGLNEATCGFYPGSRYPIYVKIVLDGYSTGGKVHGRTFEYAPADLVIWPDEIQSPQPPKLTINNTNYDVAGVLTEFETMLVEARNQIEYDYYESEYCKQLVMTGIGMLWVSNFPNVIKESNLTAAQISANYESEYAAFIAKDIRPNYGAERTYLIVVQLIMLGVEHTEAVLQVERFKQTGKF